MSSTRESRVPAGVAPADYRRAAAYRLARWCYRHLLSWPVDPLVRAAVWLREGRRRGGTFEFAGRSYPYCVHLHNRSWRNERIVEVPIVWAEIAARPGARILEIGNVAAHYQRFRRDTVDKYEPFPGVVNEDIVEFRAVRPYDLVVSISTLEHVGFDEEVRDPGKSLRAVEAIRRLLAPGGLAADHGASPLQPRPRRAPRFGAPALRSDGLPEARERRQRLGRSVVGGRAGHAVRTALSQRERAGGGLARRSGLTASFAGD